MENRFLPNPYLDYPYLIIKNFLTPQECNLIVREMKHDSSTDKAMVKRRIYHGVVVPGVDAEIRRTSICKLSEHLETIYQDNFLKHQPKIEEYFAMAMTTATAVQALQYQTNDFYKKHADDSNEIVDKEGNTVGFVCVAQQRKLSSVLFVSSHETNNDQNILNSFDGGELVFNYLYDKDGHQIRLQPKAGEMIIFPSNPYFSHEVRPVKSGYRATLVQWHNGLY